MLITDRKSSVVLSGWPSLTVINHHWPLSTAINHHWPSLTIIDHHWLSLTIIDRHWLSLTIIDRQLYKSGIYFILVSLIQTINLTTSQDPWTFGQEQFQGKFHGQFQGNFQEKFQEKFQGKFQGKFQWKFQGKFQGNCRFCHVNPIRGTFKSKALLRVQFSPALGGDGVGKG